MMMGSHTRQWELCVLGLPTRQEVRLSSRQQWTLCPGAARALTVVDALQVLETVAKATERTDSSGSATADAGGPVW